jgi:hypothetical protein
MNVYEKVVCIAGSAAGFSCSIYIAFLLARYFVRGY